MPLRALALLPLIGLSGCLPIPNTRVHAPRIEGTVLRDGQPLSGAVVRLEASRGEPSSAATDAQGRFSVGPVTEFRLTKSIGDPTYVYDLTIEAADGRYLGLSRRELGAVPDDLRIVCDLARPQTRERRGRREDGPPHHCAPAP